MSATTSAERRLGSPPRMRGKVKIRDETPEAAGITPAYAGKRRSVPRSVVRLGDHPRVCGEKSFTVGGKLNLMGSPPRMRGKGIPAG